MSRAYSRRRCIVAAAVIVVLMSALGLGIGIWSELRVQTRIELLLAISGENLPLQNRSDVKTTEYLIDLQNAFAQSSWMPIISINYDSSIEGRLWSMVNTAKSRMAFRCLRDIEDEISEVTIQQPEIEHELGIPEDYKLEL